MGDDALLGGVARRDQGAGAGDEVREGVGLLLALAVEVPAPAGVDVLCRDAVDEPLGEDEDRAGAVRFDGEGDDPGPVLGRGELDGPPVLRG